MVGWSIYFRIFFLWVLLKFQVLLGKCSWSNLITLHLNIKEKALKMKVIQALKLEIQKMLGIEIWTKEFSKLIFRYLHQSKSISRSFKHFLAIIVEKRFFRNSASFFTFWRSCHFWKDCKHINLLKREPINYIKVASIWKSLVTQKLTLGFTRCKVTCHNEANPKNNDI